MGTKRPSCTLFDTLSNINTSDRKLHPGGKISRDPSPRPVMTAQSERERDSNREEDWRREREMEKTRDKTRYKDVNPRERYYEKAPPSRGREGDREWRERDRRQEDDTRRNGRPLSNLERDCEREVERGMKKGDTFPRMRKGSPEQRIKMMYTTEMDEEIQDGRPRDRPKRTETYFRENERGMVPQRERYRDRERDEIRGRVREEGQKSGGRPVDVEKSRHRDRYQDSGSGFQHRRREVSDSWDRRDRDAGRKREKPRPNMDGREARTSPHRQRDRDIYSDRTEEAQRSQGRRDTRSEGDSDEREFRRERMRDREREELIYQHSKSEGDDRGKRMREKDQNRQGYRDEDRQRYTDRDRDRDGDRSRRKAVEKDRERYREGDRRAAREPDRQGERWKESGRDPRDDRGWSDDRYREYDQRRDRERKEREADPRRDDTTGRSSRSPNKMAPRVPPRSQSSGEWSSDMDSDQRYRYRYRDRDNLEERESGRDSTTENERDVDNQRDPQRAAERRQKEQKRSERQERDRGEMTDSVPEQRRMWLEPQRGKNSRDKFVDQERNTRRKERRKEEEEEERSMEAQTEWGRERRHKKGEPDERYFDQSSYRERYEGTDESWREAEGVSVDGEEVGEVWRETNKERKEYLSDSSGGIEGRRLRDAEGESMTDNTEESDREEECGSNYTTQGRCESGWKQDRDSMVSTEDGFVTVSSGGDEEDEREEDEDAFEDCREFLEGGVTYKGCLPGERQGEWTAGKEEVVDEEDQGGEEKPRVICVIGQTSRHSIHSDELLTQGVEGDNLNLERCRHSDNDVVAQQPQTDQHTAQSRNDDYPTINNQDTESKAERDTSREERVTTGETSEVYRRHRASSQLQDTETGEGMRSNAEIAQMKRDLQTERLLNEWREKNKELAKREMVQCPPVVSNPYADVCSQANIEKIQPILDELKAGVMSPEEEEAIRIRLSGAWSMSELPKRHSQAPHLKWAKDVVREILGHSEEKAVDEPTPHGQDDRVIDQSETVIEDKEQQEAVSRRETTDEAHSEPELEGEELLDVEGLRGMGESQTDMHADQFTTVHDDTPTHIHVDTPLDTAGKEEIDKEAKISGQLPLDKEDTKVTERGDEVMLSEIRKEEIRDKEVEMYLSVSNTLYKPSSCPILNYDSDSNLPIPSNEGKSQEEEDETDESEEEWQKGEPGGRDISAEVGKMGVGEHSGVESKEGEMVVDSQIERGTATSTSSFRDLGPEARFRRRGIRKTTQRSNGEHEKVEEEEEGVGRDRRTRIFSITDDEDDRSKSWAEVDLRNILDTLGRRKRNSRIFNAQLYQQYSEAAQNFEILRQARSDVVSVCEDNPPSPVPSPPPARRPLPPLPPVPHPHSLSHTGSVTSVKSLPLPDRPKTEDRPSSPRLSISIGTQSSLLWRDLPGVRDSGELDMLTEDQRRLQEVRFEVVTSEASYCRSLDIVVEHFVKSKQLGALLTTQDRNWLFSRLADVRAISHSFLSKLEERMEKDIVHFTVCDIIARQCQRFKMVYVPYLTNQSYQDATYQRLMNENPGFKQIVEKLERSPVCQRLPLRSFLVLPFQRITRIKLLVQNIVKRTTPGTTEATQAIKAMRLLEKLIQESNDSISQMKNIESLVSLSAKVDFECRTLPLISQSRRLLREGLITQLMDFSLKETERSVYLHLFNDYLLLSLQKEGGRFTVIDHCPVLELRVENCRVKLHSLQKNLFRLYMSNKSLLLRTDTQGDKLRWISALSLPHPEVDFSTSQDVDQMQCIRAFVAQQPDELSLEKADVILVHQQSSDNWVEGTRLSDRHRGWVRESHLETITNAKVRQRNLSDALKLTTATAAV